MEEITYKDYIKKELFRDFVKTCNANSKDFYGSGCISTAHCVMESLMAHTYKDVWKEPKVTPKEAWDKAMETSGHSGMSAAITATIIARFSPRGEEFKKWCIKDDVVMVNWK